MNRAFLSLYLLVAACVLGMGWGLDRLWHHFNPEPVLSLPERELLALVASKSFSAQPQVLLSSRVDWFGPGDLAGPDFVADLAGQPFVVLNNAAGEREIYQQLPSGSTVRLTLPAEVKHQSLYRVFLGLFYGALGLVIVIWAWPLMRDLRRLERYTQRFGQDLVPEAVSVSPGSAVRHLATAFNRMNERIRGLLASHKDMTYAVSHELRTPLARMKFALAIIDADGLAHPRLQSMAEDLQEMDGLITQLLTYAGYEQYQGVLDQKRGDMAPLLHTLVARLTANAPSFCAIEIDCEAPAWVTCEWHLMERAVLNVIQNALRFARTRVWITLRSDDTGYCLQVRDDGPGVPESERARIFESFVRLDAEPNSRVRGFGLGLAIVKRVMTWHQGEVHVSAGAEGGAVFSLSWPRVSVID